MHRWSASNRVLWAEKFEKEKHVAMEIYIA